MMAASAAILIATGGFTAVITRDTVDYLTILGFPAMFDFHRAPYFGWIAWLLSFGGKSYAAIPAIQFAVHCAATWLFVAQLRRFGLSARAGLSVGAALLFANSVLTVTHDVHPESFAISAAVFAFAATLRLAEEPARWAWMAVFAGSGVSYALRPSFLPLIVILPALFLCLRAVARRPRALARAMAILLVSALPFLGIGSLRYSLVGDFNIASFGGYVMSGTATLMLSDDIVARLPGDVKPLAAELLKARKAGEESGAFIGIPRNAEGARSYHSAALAYFDVFARTHDDILKITWAQLRDGERIVDYNRRMTRFSLAVFRAAPDRYAAWVVGASTRLFGRSFVTNLPAILALAVILLAWPWRLLTRGETIGHPASRADVPVLSVCAILWLAASAPLTVLIHAPANRFIETSSLLVAAPLIYWASLLVRPRTNPGGARA
jgi:hypothetical protein